MLAARRARIPYLVTFHTGGHSSGARNRMRNVQWRALGPLLRGAAGAVAVSRFEQRIFQQACHIDPAGSGSSRTGETCPAGNGRPESVAGRIVWSGRWSGTRATSA